MNRTDSSPTGRFQTGRVALVAGAHFLHDVFSAFLSPLLPLLIPKLGLSLFKAGSLSLFTNLPPLFNPLLGSLIDRGGYSRALVIVAPAISGTAMCLMGLAPNYAVLAVLLLSAGISIAAIHVAGPVLIAELSGERVGRGMGFFMVGGELARTIGPIIAVQLVTSLTLEGLWQIIPTGFVASLALWWQIGRVPISPRRESPSGLLTVWREMRRDIASVFGVMTARAFLASAMSLFLPTYIFEQTNSLWQGSAALSVYQLVGAAGSLLSGTLSDRIGRRTMLFAATALSPVFMLLFVEIRGDAMWVILAGLGFTTLATTPVLWAQMIESSKANRAAASGTFTMMNFAIRAAIGLVVGAMGDAWGLQTTFRLCAYLAVLAVPFVFLIPKPTQKKID